MRNVPDIVVERIEAAHRRLGHPLEHISYEINPGSRERTMQDIRCKICGVQIAGHVEHDRHSRMKIEKGQRVVYKVQTFARFPIYNEVQLFFDDTSKHVSHLCKHCVARLDEPDMMENIYAADLAQWAYEEMHGHGEALWHTAPGIMTRRPVSWVDLGGLS